MRAVPSLVELDSCISQLVVALNEGGIKTTSSCCGHGKTDGYILCEDYLLIVCKERGEEVVNPYKRDWNEMAKINGNVINIMLKRNP